MAGVTLLRLAYILIYVFLVPWTLLLIPLLGLWYITFLSQFLIYGQMDKELGIEEQFRASDSESSPSSKTFSC